MRKMKGPVAGSCATDIPAYALKRILRRIDPQIEDVAPDLVELNCDEILANLNVNPTARRRQDHCKPVIRPISTLQW